MVKNNPQPELHPDKALSDTERHNIILPACEHIAGNEKFIDKAFKLSNEIKYPFDITLDLEDGAPQGNETQQLELICEKLLESKELTARVGVRVHAYDSEYFKTDIKQILRTAGTNLAYITIPKTQSIKQLQTVINYINQVGKEHELDSLVPIHVLIETHQALNEAWEIAALPQVEVLDFGIMDFISSHNGAIPESCMLSPGQFEHPLVRRAKERISAAAHAYSKVPSHSVCVQFRDTEQVFKDAQRAYKEFGFMRMWSIHPAQIEPICEAMSPNDDEIDIAGKILLKAYAAAWAPISYEDRLHDCASYRYYWSLLKRAMKLQREINSEVIDNFF